MALSTIGLSTSRWNSRNKSIALMVIYPVIVLVVTYWQLTLVCTIFEHPEGSNAAFLVDKIYWTMLPFLAMGFVVWFMVCLKNQDDIIARLFHGHQIGRADNPDLYNMIETMAIQLGHAMPEIFIIKTTARNAFASSLNDGTDRIYVTQGLLEYLAKDEVESVIAHEYAHILAHDTRWVGLSLIFTNLFSGIPSIIRSNNKFENLDIEKSSEWFYRFFLSLIFLPVWLGFALVSIIRVFLLIEREHDADSAALQITKNPDALMRALIRINKRARIPHVPHDIMFLCIDNPRGGFFSTHPHILARLKHIARLSQTPIPTIEVSSEAPIHKRFTKNKWLHRSGKPTKFLWK